MHLNELYLYLHNLLLIVIFVCVCVCRSGSGQCAGGRLSADVCGLQGEVRRPEEPQTAAHRTAVHLYLTAPPVLLYHPTNQGSPISFPCLGPLLQRLSPAPLWQGGVHAGTQNWNILVRSQVVRRSGASAGFSSLSSQEICGSPRTE